MDNAPGMCAAMYSFAGRVSRITTCCENAFHELVHWHWLRIRAVSKVLVHQTFEFSETTFGHRSKNFRQFEHLRVGKDAARGYLRRGGNAARPTESRSRGRYR
jgi:hypothetical protein